MQVAGSPTGPAAALITAAYAPLLAWGPVLAVTIFTYWRRRRRQPLTTNVRG
jgi:hypothetical protein